MSEKPDEDTTNEASSQSSSRWYQSGINKPPVSTEGFLYFEYPAYLSRLKRTDERTRIADLPSLRVRVQWLLSFAEDCKTRITRRFLIPSIAHHCRVLRAG